MISEKQYAEWVAAWKVQHPNQFPPTYQQTVDLQDMFLFPDSMFAPPKAEVPHNAAQAGCNRHDDCAKADADWWERHPGEKYPPPSFHCHDECCEECFGN